MLIEKIYRHLFWIMLFLFIFALCDWVNSGSSLVLMAKGIINLIALAAAILCTIFIVKIVILLFRSRSEIPQATERAKISIMLCVFIFFLLKIDELIKPPMSNPTYFGLGLLTTIVIISLLGAYKFQTD